MINRRQILGMLASTIYLPVAGGKGKVAPPVEEPTERYKGIPYANVADYGELGTTDDTAVFQAALDDNVGGRLYVPEGTYRVNWVIGKPCTILSDALLLSANRNLPCVMVGDGVTKVQGVVIEKMSMRGDGDYPQFAEVGLQISEGVSHSSFNNLSLWLFTTAILKISNEEATLPTKFNFFKNLDLYAAAGPGCEAVLDVRYGANGGFTTAQYLSDTVIRGVGSGKGKSVYLKGARIGLSNVWVECEAESGILTEAQGGLMPRLVCSNVTVDSPHSGDVLLDVPTGNALASEVVEGTIAIDGLVRATNGTTYTARGGMHVPYQAQLTWPRVKGAIEYIP